VQAARALVLEKRTTLERLVTALLSEETLERPELERLLGAAQVAA
jgi:ATP-dependent Zn protease